MLKTNNIQITKSKLKETKVSVTFEDPEVQPDQYTFFEKKLKTYKFYINNEYILKSEMEYEESSQQLSIVINIIIPEYLIPKDPKKAKETIMDPIDVFQKFYEVETIIYKRNHQKISIF